MDKKENVQLTGGEVDVRGCYTAMATAHMLNVDKRALAELADMVTYVKRCQVNCQHQFPLCLCTRVLKPVTQVPFD